MAALTLTADGYVNNIRFINYIPRRELHIKRITNRQRPSSIFLSCVMWSCSLVKWFLLPPLFNCISSNDQVSRITIQYSQLVNLLLLKKVDLQHNWVFIGNVLNPLTTRSDWHVTSPYNIHTLTCTQVLRVLKLIRWKLLSWSNTKFS